MSIRLSLLPALVAGLFAAAPVMAQTATPQAVTPPTVTPQAGATVTTPSGAARSPAATATPAAAAAPAASATRRDTMVERRITELHSKLKITAAEEKPFGDFAQAMRDNAQRMDQAVSDKRSSAATATAVDQMKAYAELAQAHADEVSHLVGPFSTLYDTLSPEQKRMADQSFRDFSNGSRAATRPVRG